MHPHLHTKDNRGIITPEPLPPQLISPDGPRFIYRQDCRNHEFAGSRINTGCEEVMQALDECHARGFLWKAVGMCNQAKRDVTKCLRAERIERTRQNREAAREKRQQVVAAWKEIETNS